VLTLSSTLRAAQQAQDVLPVVSALVSDNPPEVARLSELTSQYTGSEPDAPFEACWCSMGVLSVFRAYLSGGSLYVQGVNPSSPTWSTWVVLDSSAGNWAGTSQVALVGSQVSSVAICYWVASDGHTIRTALWNGSSWSAVSTVVDAGAGNLVGSLVASGLDSAINRLFYQVVGGGIYETHYTGSAWSAPVGDGGGWPAPCYLGGDYLSTSAPSGTGDWYLIVCSGTTTVMVVKRFNVTTSPAGWVAGSTPLQSAGLLTGYSYGYPKLSMMRSDCLRTVVSWSETAPAPIGTQAMIAFTPTPNAIEGVVPWRYAATHGIRVFRDTATSPSWWICTSNQVYRAPADSATGLGMRLAFPQSQIVQVKVEAMVANHPAKGELVVLNENGVLRDAGVVGTAHQCLRQWSQVSLRLGYHSASGDETLSQMPFWIEGVIFHDEVSLGQPLVTLALTDGWGLLESLFSRGSVSYVNQTVGYILQRLLWHVCGVLSATGNSRLTSLTLASFTIRMGESLGLVARRLCDLGAIDLIFRTLSTSSDGTGWDSVGVAAVSRATGGSSYSFGPSSHPILQSELEAISTPTATGVEVSGLTTLSIVRNWPAVWLRWRDNPESLVDKTLGTQGATDAVAANRASDLVPETVWGSIFALANVGQEVGDQIDVTIATAPVAGLLCNVVGLLTTYHQPDGRLLQTIHLQGSN
jgi:hypothetical protein